MDCATAEAALDSVVKNDFASFELAVIRQWIGGEFFTPEGSTRQFYYPETYWFESWDHWTPTVWFDGAVDQTGVPFEGVDSTRSLYREKIQNRLVISSPLAMNLEIEFGAKGDSGTAHAQVVATDTIFYQDLHLRLTITESDIDSKAKTYHQVLRDYFPDTDGISFAIAQGDTFAHSESFVVDDAWVAEDCRIVAFVQDDTTREVVQAVQKPVVTAAPQVVQNLRITLSVDDLLLRWSPVAADTNGAPLEVDFYRIYRDTTSSLGSGSIPLATTVDTFYLDDSGVVGDLGVHYFYCVTAVSGSKESTFSGAVGEFDRFLSH